MTFSVEIERVEGEIAKIGGTIKTLCEEAGINQSTWTRWKAQSHTPNLGTWARVNDALERLKKQNTETTGAA